MTPCHSIEDFFSNSWYKNKPYLSYKNKNRYLRFTKYPKINLKL